MGGRCEKWMWRRIRADAEERQSEGRNELSSWMKNHREKTSRQLNWNRRIQTIQYEADEEKAKCHTIASRAGRRTESRRSRAQLCQLSAEVGGGICTCSGSQISARKYPNTSVDLESWQEASWLLFFPTKQLFSTSLVSKWNNFWISLFN